MNGQFEFNKVIRVALLGEVLSDEIVSNLYKNARLKNAVLDGIITEADEQDLKNYYGL